MLAHLVSRTYVSAEEAAVEACRAACVLLRFDVAFVGRFDDDRIEIVAVHDEHGLGLAPGGRLVVADPSWRSALAGAEDAWTCDAMSDPPVDVPGAVALGLRSWAAGALRDRDGSLYGVLCAVGRRSAAREGCDQRVIPLLGGLLAREQELERVRDREAATQQALARRAVELERSEARYRLLVDEISDVLVRIGVDGEVQFVNRAWTELSGVPVEEVVGHGCFDRVHPDDQAVAAAHLQRVVLGEDAGVREVRFQGRGDEYRWMAVKGRALRDEAGEFAGFLGTLTDITERRRAEALMRDALAQAEAARDEAQRALAEAERASRAKSEFLSRMSHELRTPLNAILGFGQLLELGDLDGEDAENVDQILKAGRHLLDLINEVLDVVRVEAGKLTLSLEPVDVGEVVTESLDLVRTAAAARRISLRAPARSTGAAVVADRQRLKQVLVNLLSNAVKYNLDEGEVVVSCAPVTPSVTPSGGAGDGPVDGPVESGHGWVRLCVQDTGRGIPPDRLGDVFTPFDRLGAEASGIEGTGVGLSLTKTLVEALGGRIGVTSELGRGTTFWIDLPAAAPLPAEPAPAADEPGITRTVLYVEDNPSNIVLVRRVLARRPHVRLVVVQDGADAVEAAHRLMPDLVLLDLHLPGMHGAGVLGALRAADCVQLREVPVVVVTADLTAGNERRMLEAGATLFLPKPLDVRRLLDVVDDQLPRP